MGEGMSGLVQLAVDETAFLVQGSPTIESWAPLGFIPGEILPMLVLVRVAGTELEAVGDEGVVRRTDVLEITRGFVFGPAGQEHLVDMIRRGGVGEEPEFEPEPAPARPSHVFEETNPAEVWPGFAGMGGGAITLPAELLNGNATTVGPTPVAAAVEPEPEEPDVDDDWPDLPSNGRSADPMAPEPGLEDAVTLGRVRVGDKAVKKMLREAD